LDQFQIQSYDYVFTIEQQTGPIIFYSLQTIWTVFGQTVDFTTYGTGRVDDDGKISLVGSGTLSFDVPVGDVMLKYSFSIRQDIKGCITDKKARLVISETGKVVDSLVENPELRAQAFYSLYATPCARRVLLTT
jgi:hypothetical protein